MTNIEAQATDALGSTPTPAELLHSVVGDPELHAAVAQAANGIGRALAAAWKKHRGTECFIAAVSQVLSQQKATPVILAPANASGDVPLISN